ncbi:MAG: MotA/TolQ/ExbB proton channel family protein [Pseudomonadota bacterium]
MEKIFYSGGVLMFPLLLCSIISLTVIIERSLFWIGVGMKRNRKVVEQVFDLCLKEDWDGVQRVTAGSKSYVARILLSGVMHRQYSPIKAMELAAADEIFSMQRFMDILDTIITIAPLLGILGTVVGIIETFDMLGTSGIDNPQAVTGGIAKALITTASGLAIAIMTVFPYNYFNTRIQRAAQIIEKYTTSFEIDQDRRLSCSEEDHEA